MALTVNWNTKVVTVPKADLTLISGSLYELDLDDFRLELKSIEASEEGVAFDDIHAHSTEVTVAGTTLARVVEIINGYTVEFEELGTYAVNLVGANSNVAQVSVINAVSVRSFNTAGLSSGASINARLTTIEASAATILAANVSADLTALSGGTTTAVKTTATQADDYYNELTIIIVNSSGTVARSVNTYESIDGVFNVDELPFAPDLNDRVIVISRASYGLLIDEISSLASLIPATL